MSRTEKEGQGTETHADGSCYVGEWGDSSQGNRPEEWHGKGCFNSSDGRLKYVGEWKDDKEWEGTSYDKEGNITATYSEGVRTEK